MQLEENNKSISILNKLTKGDFKRAWDGIVDLTRKALSFKESTESDYESREVLHRLIKDCIYAKGGDVSARNRTVELGAVYLTLSSDGREQFHHILAHEFDIDREALKVRIQALEAAQEDKEIVRAEIDLKNALDPPRKKLLKQFSSLPNGLKLLIDMRASLLAKVKDDEKLYKLSHDIKEILAAWFDVGLLDLKEISWDSPAALLEKLIAYEAVHEIRSWEELRNRLDSDRLCFAFFHNKLPSEPLIFVEVALVNELSENIQELLKKENVNIDPQQADTAIFYSISSTQPGLAGISLGNFLIKKVVQKLAAKFEEVKHFATLSPVPGFRKWLESKLENGHSDILLPAEIERLTAKHTADEAGPLLHEILKEQWQQKKETAALVKPILIRLCAHYLVNERKGSRAFDPVANFHLANGARLEQINWLADASQKGMKRSYGIMVNYLYKLGEIDANHENYVTRAHIAVSREVKALLK